MLINDLKKEGALTNSSLRTLINDVGKTLPFCRNETFHLDFIDVEELNLSAGKRYSGEELITIIAIICVTLIFIFMIGSIGNL